LPVDAAEVVAAGLFKLLKENPVPPDDGAVPVEFPNNEGCGVAVDAGVPAGVVDPSENNGLFVAGVAEPNGDG
jgi:hypothetical protein